MRIVGGRLRGRPIAAPEVGVRPTSDRVREAVFNILEHGIAGFSLDGVHVLDLFAGTGALGFEALSRGAGYCLFVENDAQARAAIRQNIDSLSLTGTTKLFRRDATNLGIAPNRVAFRLVFLDPPYGRGLASVALESAAGGRWLASDAIAVTEDRKDAELELPKYFDLLDRRSWGDTEVTFARYRG